jgi:hypothetical protein
MRTKCTTRVAAHTNSRPWPAHCTPAVLAKTAIVQTLAWIFAWRPSLAMRLGRLVLRVWPGFRGA